ncbi:MAG: PEP-CTERM sorting domain-containing protein [Isosphaeraceae bacterium]|nr:PEP-CTERM sorting domain-containing protein [Isosphaeraceae bacterium]
MFSRNLRVVRVVFSLAFVLCISSRVVQANLYLTAHDVGWYNSVGDHPKFAKSYMMGSAGAFDGLFYRSYFVFDLATITQPIRSAQIQLYTDSGGYASPDLFEKVNFFDVSTPISTLMYGNTGQTGIHDDLGTGTIYGASLVSATTTPRWFSATLNSAGLAMLNAGLGTKVAIGGSLGSIGRPGQPVNELVYTTSFMTSGARLYLTYNTTAPGGFAALSAVPEPSTLAGAVAAMVLGGATMLRRRRVDA